MSVRQRRSSWLVLLVAVVALVALGSRTTPRTGYSEDHVYSLASQMKCLQCVGESVANSQAQIAVQMRSEIRDRLRAGRSDDEILSYFADRYGQRVLLNPPSSGLAALVWIVPVVVIAAAVAMLALAMARARSLRVDGEGSEVSDDDRALVRSALEQRHEDGDD